MWCNKASTLTFLLQPYLSIFQPAICAVAAVWWARVVQAHSDFEHIVLRLNSEFKAHLSGF